MGPTSECHIAALTAVEVGLSVIPVGLDKKPLVPWAEFQTRRATAAEVDKWFSQFPGANLAVVTGAISGVLVVDFDTVGGDWPPTPFEMPTQVVIKTPRGGFHYYAKHINQG